MSEGAASAESMSPAFTNTPIRSDKREEYRSDRWTFADLAKEIGRQWQSLDKSTRNEYYTRAVLAKEQYQIADATYSQTEECKRYQSFLEDWKSRESGTTSLVQYS